MQAKNLNGGQELICINVDKVYDWVINERGFDYSPGEVDFTPVGSVPVDGENPFDGATLTCEVEPSDDPIDILARDDRPFVIDGTPVTLQQLNIRKNFDVTLFITLADGTVLTSETQSVQRCEQVTLCAPEGTEVEITYTDLDCFVCTEVFAVVDPGEDPAAGTVDLTGTIVTINTCQSIQSTYPVTVEFLAEFCEPRDVLPTPCPAPIRPDQCPVVFPNGNNG
ncbi:hypothetical protein DXT76_00290 [Halobacillus trueperi]|uniref:Uncharacterized protein n=1 Tax=Halobacillus trueperi TaxID=156205 RepID=A0A3D8VTT6_9BACI|nr:hypothetical protein [Halobacillus trueperi]RDY72740.1 hypothetical protein DXT76_00290 [Halobacillus trueperi]